LLTAAKVILAAADEYTQNQLRVPHIWFEQTVLNHQLLMKATNHYAQKLQFHHHPMENV
jgi:homogentisate 1,2-dioxygenase